MHWKDIVWPWGALKRERAARWSLVGECVDARRDATMAHNAYQELADEYDALRRESNKLVGRIEAYEVAMRGVPQRDPKTGRFVKK